MAAKSQNLKCEFHCFIFLLGLNASYLQGCIDVIFGVSSPHCVKSGLSRETQTCHRQVIVLLLPVAAKQILFCSPKFTQV